MIFFKKTSPPLCLAVLLTCTVIGCVLDTRDDDADTEPQVEDLTVMLCNKPLQGKFGIDTNQPSGDPDNDNSNFDIQYAVEQHISWVGRYIVADGCGSNRLDPKCLDPDTGVETYLSEVHSPVTPEEIVRWREKKISLAFLWELHDKYRACSAPDRPTEMRWGREDGRAARDYMKYLGAPDHTAVYFTVDFDIGANAWKGDKAVFEKIDSTNVQKCKHSKNMILKYFEGIRTSLLPYSVGVYGSYGTVNGLFEEKKVSYAWQQVYHCDEKREPRAHLKQYDIHALQDGWLKVVDKPGGLDLDLATVEAFKSMWNFRKHSR